MAVAILLIFERKNHSLIITKTIKNFNILSTVYMNYLN